MIFECPNCALCCVASMKTRRDKLEVDVFLHYVLLKDLRGFVVEPLVFGLEPARFQEGNYASIRRQNDFVGAILHGFRVNEVAVVVVNDENVRVSTEGRNKETAGKVRVDLAGGGMAVGVQEMCFESRWFRS
jgi:hypothetical protein